MAMHKQEEMFSKETVLTQTRKMSTWAEETCKRHFRNTLEGCEEGGGERPKGEVRDIRLKKKQ